MLRLPVLLSILLGLGGGAACKSSTTPTAPAPTRMSVAVAFPAGAVGGTVFIGNTVQFEARETLSDGTTRVANTATWGSDNSAVATVSSAGLVTALAAGEATIFADVNPRGTMRIRVFPDFGGMWTGRREVMACEDSGDLAGACGVVPELLVGTQSPVDATFTQTEASVGAVLGSTGDSDPTTITTTGTITVGGELQLAAAPILPPESDNDSLLQNWRSRSDTPTRMTGTFEVLLTVPPGAAGPATGSALVTFQLRDMARM